MSDFKGTPGPWSVDRNNVHSGRIATIHHCIGNDWIEIWSPNWPDTEEKQESNANLIAAAPELLEALQDMVESYQYESSMENPSLLKARAAIAKALGQ